MELKVELLKADDGHRIALLSQNGMPLYYPNLYITNEKRRSSYQTHLNILHHIKIFFFWCEVTGIEVEDRFKRGDVLKAGDILNLVDFCAWDAETIKRIRSGARLLKSAYREVSRSEASSRIGSVKEYLEFLFKKLAQCSKEDPRLASMLSDIKAYKPRVKSHRSIQRVELTQDQERILNAVVMPNHPENPWSVDPGVRLRNLIMIYITLETGIRRSELAALRINDIDFVNRTVSVYRRHNDKQDPRIHQPQAKTGERTLPLSPELIEQIDNYVIRSRSKVPGAKKHPFLLVSHSGGKGGPLSVGTINHCFGQLSKAFPELGRLHPHKFRHHWNYDFSRKVDEHMKGEPEEDKKAFDENARAYAMGWKPGGTMSQVYNRRFDEEKAGELLKKRNSKFKIVIKDSDEPK